MHDQKLEENSNGHSERKMSVNELYDFIVKRMSPEEALKKLLTSSLVKYDHLKFKTTEEMVHPEIIIAMAALDLGWDIAIQQGDKDAPVDGMVLGTSDYITGIFKKENDNG